MDTCGGGGVSRGCRCARYCGCRARGKQRALTSSAAIKLKIKTTKRVQAVCKVGIGVIGIATGTCGASGRASRRGKVGAKGVEKVRASNQLPVNLKRGDGFLVVLGIKILQFNGRTVIKAEEQAV